MHHLKYPSAWLPLLAGLVLLVASARAGTAPLALALLPSVLLIAGGARSLLFTDLRASQLAAIGSVTGLLVSIPLGFIDGLELGFGAAAMMLLAFLSVGWFQIRLLPALDGVPAHGPNPFYSAQVALDQAVLGVMAVLTPSSGDAALREAVAESEAALEYMQKQGFISDPRSYHRDPPLLADPEISKLRVKQSACELMRWSSDFNPPEGMPGRDRLLGHVENRTAQALLLRQEKPVPWLVCVHGFGMGDPQEDFQTFRAAQLHQMGLNVALFTLPLHGARAPGRVNGEKFFGLSIMDFIHADSQAIWDLRRLIAWLRIEGATRVGVYGISLGAYTSALLAGVESGLDCVIAGIPPTDMIAHREYLASPLEQRLGKIAGLSVERDCAVNSVVAPLVMGPLVPPQSRFIYGATGDQFVPVEQVHALWQHWEQPEVSWCRAGHLGALMQRAPRELVRRALSRTLLELT
jgi:hypothetical protein